MLFFRRRSVSLFCLLPLAACMDGRPLADETSSSVSEIIGGRLSTPAEDYVVALEVSKPTGGDACTAELVAPNVIVTARHCLLKNQFVLLCDKDGNPLNSVDLTPVPPESISAYAGTEAKVLAGNGKAIFPSPSSSLCREDWAYVVLDRTFEAPLIKLRLDAPWYRAHPYDVPTITTVVGWGGDGSTNNMMVRGPYRRAKDDVPVVKTSPRVLPSHAFFLPAGTGCLGDSGMAAIVDGVILGLNSRLEGSSCTVGDQIFFSLIDSRSTAEQAFTYAKQPFSWELPNGESCAVAKECSSKLCVGQVCRAPCSSATDCQAPFVCDTGACVPPVAADAGSPVATPDEPGCRAAPSPHSLHALAAAATLLLVRLKRRKTKRI